MKNTKHILAVLMAMLMFAATAVISAIAFADTSVEINSTTFPDATFRDAVALMNETDHDGSLSEDERDDSVMIV